MCKSIPFYKHIITNVTFILILFLYSDIIIFILHFVNKISYKWKCGVLHFIFYKFHNNAETVHIRLLENTIAIDQVENFFIHKCYIQNDYNTV